MCAFSRLHLIALYSLCFAAGELILPLFVYESRHRERRQIGRLNEGQTMCRNGGQFVGEYCSGLDPEECTRHGRTAVCLDGRCCTEWRDGSAGSRSDDERGEAACRPYGQYTRQLCQRAANCGLPTDSFICVRGFCCYYSSVWNGGGAQWDQDGWDRSDRRQGARPNGVAGLCLRDARFPRFMGQFCDQNGGYCAPAFDHQSSQPVPIRVQCVEGVCCGQGHQGREWDQPDWGGGDTPGLVPVRTQTAFCYNGSLAARQCLSGADCAGDESCLNQLCCPRAVDQMRYACGGLAALSRCESNGLCWQGFECVAAGVCCECPAGQPQPGVRDCQQNGANTCSQGYRCHSTGFCCPQCPNRRMPFGSCHLGRCAPNFSCQPGNICCESGTRELEIGADWTGG